MTSAALKQLRTPVVPNSVDIAKDVLAALTLDKFVAKGIYLWTGLDERTSCSLERAMADGICEVCALGGLFVAAAARKAIDPTLDEEGPFSPQARRKLASFFSTHQLELIENYYEGFSGHNKYIVLHRKQRMIKIMQNIVDNNGVFIP